MKIEGDEVIFSSGRKRYANGGIIGICPDIMDVMHGYDGGFYSCFLGDDYRDEDERLSAQDLIELADYMIEQWSKFRALHT